MNSAYTGEDIMLDMKELCQTTGWHNNCALNCLTHFLISQIEGGKADDLFLQDKEYLALLQTFKEYYHIETDFSLEALKDLIKTYNSPTDQEAVFGPPLRMHLGKIIASMADNLWLSEGANSFSECFKLQVPKDIKDTSVKLKEPSDIATVYYRANQLFLDKLRAEYIARLTEIKQNPVTPAERERARKGLRANKIPDEQITNEMETRQVQFYRATDLEDEFTQRGQAHWLKEGCANYAARIGTLKHGAMISIDHVGMLCKHLQIGVVVNTPDTISSLIPWFKSDWKHKTTLSLYNAGIHWEYFEPHHNKALAEKHNRFYENLDKSGKFNLKAPIDISDEVMAYVIDLVDSRPSSPASQVQSSASSPQGSRSPSPSSSRTPSPVSKQSIPQLGGHRSSSPERKTSVSEPKPSVSTSTATTDTRKTTSSPPQFGLHRAQSPERKVSTQQQKEVANPAPVKSEPIRPLAVQARAPVISPSTSSTTKEKEPRAFVTKMYGEIYAQLEQRWDWDTKPTISDAELHQQTMTKLKTKHSTITPEEELWLKNNHTKTALEATKKPKF